MPRKCGKKPYDSKKEAEEELDKIRKVDRYPPVPGSKPRPDKYNNYYGSGERGVYFCDVPGCEKWHITSQDKRT